MADMLCCCVGNREVGHRYFEILCESSTVFLRKTMYRGKFNDWQRKRQKASIQILDKRFN